MGLVNIIGLGYIGLPTTLMLAKSGVQVVGTDFNPTVVDSLEAGVVTFQEEGLEELFNDAVAKGVRFTTEYQATDLYVITVPTPYINCSKRLDPRWVVAAFNAVLDVCELGSIIVIESTIAPGATDKHIRPLVEARGLKLGEDVHIAHAPERIMPGRMIHELVNNPRTIGVDSPSVGERLRDLYAKFCRAEIVITDIRTAEMSKVVENTYRDINIAYANELAKICRADNMDVHEIVRIANKHPRVNILQPGPGVGGHCISVDPWFLVGDYPDLTNLILAARRVNDSMPAFVLSRVRSIMLERGIRDLARVGLYGLTYKENVDDTRESPTLQLLHLLDAHLAFGIKVYDPFVKMGLDDNQYSDFDEFLSQIDVVVIMVGHDHIIANMSKLQGKTVLDTRNVCGLDGVYRL